MDRFLLCTNPLNKKDNSEYILDTVAGCLYAIEGPNIAIVNVLNDNAPMSAVQSSEKQARRWFRSLLEQLPPSELVRHIGINPELIGRKSDIKHPTSSNPE